MNDEPRTNETVPIGNLLGCDNRSSSQSPPLTPEERERQNNEHIRRYRAESRRDAARAYFDEIRKQYPEMMAGKTRWDDPKLAANSNVIEKVIAWGAYQEAAKDENPWLSPTPPPKKGLLLAGATGRGKTRSLFALMEHMAVCGIQFHYWFSTDWFAELSKQVKYGRDDARSWVERIANIPVVILDDLGQEAIQARSEEWAMSWLFRLLDLRIGNGKSLIISTNLKAEQLAVGGTDRTNTRQDPLLRRLLDLCEVVKFDDGG